MLPPPPPLLLLLCASAADALPLPSFLSGRGNGHDVCKEEAGAPPQERMPSEKRRWRQSLMQRHVSAEQPTFEELMASTLSSSSSSLRRPAAASANDRMSAPVTVILNHYKRHTLCRQIEALMSQSSGPPEHIWICLFASPMADDARAMVLAYNSSRIAVFESTYNFKYFGRFQLALSARTPYVLVFDDDMIPGQRFLEALLHAARTDHARGALLGAIGWLLPRPAPPPDARLSSYRSLVNGTGGLYVPDLAYDLLVERLLEVDYLCSLWFMETRRARLLFREAPYTYATGEDFQLSHMLRKHADLPSFVLPVRAEDKATWGDTDHRLAYNRYSTGGRKTIELRDKIWWNGVRGGGTLHWARRHDEPRALGTHSILVLVDGPSHARELRHIFSRFSASRDAVLAVALTGGGLGGACTHIAPILGLPASSCDERRLRIFDMNVGADQPAAVGGGVGAAPAARTLRGATEIMLDLGQIVRTVRPAILLALEDAGSAAVRAAASLARFGGPPLICLPREFPAWLPQLLSAYPTPILARHGSAALTLVVHAKSGDVAALSAIHDGIHAAVSATPRLVKSAAGADAWPGLTILLPSNATLASVAFAQQRWKWPQKAKHVRYRIAPAGGDGKACSGFEATIDKLEAWEPPSHATGGAKDDAWGLILEDHVQLADAFFAYARYALAAYDLDASWFGNKGEGRLLGFSLGPPASGGDPRRGGGRLKAPSSCGMIYSASGWRALREYAAEKLSLPLGACNDAERHFASWSALEEQFLQERGFLVQYPPEGVSLCHASEHDALHPLSSGEDVAKAILNTGAHARGSLRIL